MKTWFIRISILIRLAFGVAILCTFAYFSLAESFAQEGAGIPAEKAIKSDEPGLKGEAATRDIKTENKGAADLAAPAVRKAAKAAPAGIEKPAHKAVKNVSPEREAKQAVEPRIVDEGLLDITEGAFKYRRIPRIKIAEAVVQQPGDQPKAAEARKEAEKETTGTKGLFGLSQGATDVLAKVFLFGIIIVVFILYKYRTRGRRSSVLKRFPKA